MSQTPKHKRTGWLRIAPQPHAIPVASPTTRTLRLRTRSKGFLTGEITVQLFWRRLRSRRRTEPPASPHKRSDGSDHSANNSTLENTKLVLKGDTIGFWSKQVHDLRIRARSGGGRRSISCGS